MIILFHPRATRPQNCRLPLAVLALAAVLEGREEYEIVDGNIEDKPVDKMLKLIDTCKVELLGVSAMPGPQMAAAMEASRKIREQRPHVKIAWGGYFPSIYPDTALNAKYVDFVIRGQGEDTLLELIDALRGMRSLDSILGLSYKDQFGLHRSNAERPMKGPDSFPWSPFHRLPVKKYLRPSFFGKRTAVHHASIGCPFNCSFCGVHAAYGRDEKMESPQRTVAILRNLVEQYGADSVQFYDMNFFLREDHALELLHEPGDVARAFGFADQGRDEPQRHRHREIELVVDGVASRARDIDEVLELVADLVDVEHADHARLALERVDLALDRERCVLGEARPHVRPRGLDLGDPDERHRTKLLDDLVGQLHRVRSPRSRARCRSTTAPVASCVARRSSGSTAA